MLANRTNFTASFINNEIIVIGGRNEKGNIVAWPEKYSIAENKWSQFENSKNIESSKILARYCHTQTTVSGKIVVTGGYVQETGKRALTCSEQILFLDPNDMTVLATGELNIRRCWHSASLVHEKWLIILGGSAQVRKTYFSSYSYITSAR